MNFTRFRNGPLALCVDRSVLRGVVASPELSPVPDAPEWLPGAYNNLGQAVAAVDAALLLGLGRALSPALVLLLVEGPSGLLGLVADGEPEEVSTPSPPRRGAVIEVVDRSTDLLRIDLGLLEQRMESTLNDLTASEL